MAEKTSAEVVIGGKVYTLSGYESEEYLQKVAVYINGKLNEFDSIEGYQRFPADMKATLLQLNIADDYFKAKAQAEKLEREIEAKEKEIYNLKHDLIAEQIQSENDKKEIKRLDTENRELLLNKAHLESSLEESLLGKIEDEDTSKKMKQNRKIPLINSRWVPVAENCHTGKVRGRRGYFRPFMFLMERIRMNSNKRYQNIELLAPAGSMETFQAVIHAGADAVYLGGGRFGARAYANNFTEEELLLAIDYAHIHGRKVYLTVNTLFKERELTEELYSYLLPYYEQGLDAVIIQDMGAFRLVRDAFPGLSIHTSTQMTVTNRYGAMMMKELGADRVVTAREMSFAEIRDIKDHVDIEIESFVHGALCYCYSGQCLFSSMLGGRSGNRGRCAQPCRLSYEVMDEKKHPVKRGKKSVTFTF